MNRVDLVLRTRSLVRDLTNGLFREVDVVNYINEGIDRVAQRIPEMADMPLLTTPMQEVTHLPRQWQHLLTIYSASRLCTQDERHYQAGTFMNEFEVKLDELISGINSGEITIIDPETNEPIELNNQTEYVVNNYYLRNNGTFPREGVED